MLAEGVGRGCCTRPRHNVSHNKLTFDCILNTRHTDQRYIRMLLHCLLNFDRGNIDAAALNDLRQPPRIAKRSIRV